MCGFVGVRGWLHKYAKRLVDVEGGGYYSQKKITKIMKPSYSYPPHGQIETVTDMEYTKQVQFKHVT